MSTSGERGWLIVDGDEGTEATENNKHADEIGGKKNDRGMSTSKVKSGELGKATENNNTIYGDGFWVVKENDTPFMKKLKEFSPSKEEFERLCDLLAEDSRKLTTEESVFLIFKLPREKFEQLLFKRRDEKIAQDRVKAREIVTIPFQQEPGGCDMCGKHGHFHSTCIYRQYVPFGATVGPRYLVNCPHCHMPMTPPVGFCEICCGLVQGVAVIKVCIYCGRYGDHLSEDCHPDIRAKYYNRSKKTMQ